MAPDAPTPSYDRNGNLELGWLVVVRYNPSDKAVTLSWSKDGDLYRQSKHGAVGFMPEDLAGIQDGVRNTLIHLTNPALL